MRADRLLSLMMILQTRGMTTAQALADELEVSVRTIYRDVEALSMAGVPIYAERGPGGGCALLDDYRTTLTGMTPDEVRTLLILSIPSPLSELGLSAKLRQALEKVMAALPGSRSERDAVRGRVYVDWTPAAGQRSPHPQLLQLYRAVWEDRVIGLSYRSLMGPEVQVTVEALGLVAYAGEWYLAYALDGRTRAMSVDRVLDVTMSERHYQRPEGFDLSAFWSEWATRQTERAPSYPVKVLAAPEVLAALARELGESVREQFTSGEAREWTPVSRGPSAPQSWVRLMLPFRSLPHARATLLPLGGAIEVLTPEALRLSMADYARHILARYDLTQSLPSRDARETLMR